MGEIEESDLGIAASRGNTAFLVFVTCCMVAYTIWDYWGHEIPYKKI